jgi:hypothetical protein
MQPILSIIKLCTWDSVSTRNKILQVLAFLYIAPISLMLLYSIYYENESVSSSVSDVDRYVIIRKLLDPFSTYFQYSYAGGKFKHTQDFSRKVPHTRYEVPWFVEWMDSTKRFQ